MQIPLLRSSKYIVLDVLSRIVYCYKHGPYKGLLVRHGYDPEARSDARFFQMVSVRMKGKEYTSMIQRFKLSSPSLESRYVQCVEALGRDLEVPLPQPGHPRSDRPSQHIR